MDEYMECQECGVWKTTSQYAINNRIELHHVVFKSHAGYMKNVPVNWKFLCSNCHRLNKRAVHKDEEKNLEYKRKLQAKLNKMFDKDYYTPKQIKEKLGVSESVVRGIVKTLLPSKEGYKKEELIYRMMGNKNYDISD